MARNLGINLETARSIIRVYLNQGRRHKENMGGHRYQKVTQQMKNIISNFVTENPFSTLKSINDELRRNIPQPRICDQTIARILDGMLISVKSAGKESNIPIERNTARSLNLRRQYADWFINLPNDNHVIYIDESGFNGYTQRTRGRAPVGQPVGRQVAGQRERNLNMTIAVNPQVGLIHFQLAENTTTHESFRQFLHQLLQHLHLFPENESVRIIYDRARPHLNQIVPENLRNRVSFHVLPPYSPFMKPVEQAHSCVKAAIKRRLGENNVQREIMDTENNRRRENMTLSAWRMRILRRIANQ